MNDNYVVATASTADLTKEFLKEHNIPFISYTYTIGDEIFTDDCDENSRQEVYRKMREGASLNTSAINTFTYMEFFEGFLKEGKDVVFLDMTKRISSSYNFCNEAIRELKEEYPERTIVNVDTLCVSGGLGMLVEYAISLYEDGVSMEELIDRVERRKLTIAHRFTVDDLNWLKKGGRVSNASALVGTLLSIKPVLYVTDEGELSVAAKVRGRKSAIMQVVESVLNDIKDNHAGLVIRINHADCLEEAVCIRDELMKHYPDIKEISISGLGVVIGAHCGPGLLAIFYETIERTAK